MARLRSLVLRCKAVYIKRDVNLHFFCVTAVPLWRYSAVVARDAMFVFLPVQGQIKITEARLINPILFQSRISSVKIKIKIRHYYLGIFAEILISEQYPC